ncbi:tail sheath [Bacillus phage G]|uniref:Gp178 n=1 Tax=Bacillus phage G TaxID=2884420 RepID=G3MBP4_9CAUD|nr:tail sheath [Bacillus phage G]AEO93438.1 gp178 [Bacillus phage G]
MPYKKPGAYARFVKTASAITSVGATRVMAIVGTGRMYFDSLNENIVRNNKAISDELARKGVYEVYAVTNKSVKPADLDPSNEAVLKSKVRVYEKDVDYTIAVDEATGTARIVWEKEAGADAVVTTETFADTHPLHEIVSATVHEEHLITDGSYRIQFTYIDSADSSFNTFAIINNKNEEVLGEYTFTNTALINVIPGLTMTVRDFSAANVGDSVKIDCTAAKIKAGLFDADQTTFYIHYNYKKMDAALEPKVFSDYNSVVAEYGNYEVTASGKVINSLSLGAEIAFTNGVTPIVLVQAKNDTAYEINTAIDKLRKDVVGVSVISTIVPLSTANGVRLHVSAHVLDMSDEEVGRERMAYVGINKNESYGEAALLTKGFNNERLVCVAPGSAVKEIRDLETGKVSLRNLDASYLAVAVATLGLKNDPAEPLTNKPITGFSSIGSVYTEFEKNHMAENGVLILEQSGNNIKVRHGITTAATEVNTAEITLVQIKDYVIESVRKYLGEIYIGRKLMPTVVTDVQTTLTNILSQFVSQEVILGYGSVDVVRSEDDPRAIDVKFEIEAVYPLNYINIAFSFSGVN